MRLPNTAHTSRPWRIHELAYDFRLEDVWALPTPGGPTTSPGWAELLGCAGIPRKGSSRAARAVCAIRWKIGERSVGTARTPASAPGCRRSATGCRRSCATRHPAPTSSAHFTSLYLLDDEWAAEIANRTVHGVMHIGWVPDGTGGYRGQMAV